MSDYRQPKVQKGNNINVDVKKGMGWSRCRM